MGRLTADKDFGKGGGLAIGVLHDHRVGGCVLNGASEKERGRVAPKTSGLCVKLKSICGWERQGLMGRLLGSL